MINIINHTLNMDLANKINMNSPINIKQNDTNSHKFVINLFNNSVSHDLTGTTSRIYFKKSDGTKVFLSCVLDGSVNNKLSVLLTTQVLTAIGSVACEITIYGTSGEIQTSFTFNFNVLENIRDDEAIESVSEFTALTDALAVVTDFSNVKTEVEDARLGETTLKVKLEKVDTSLAKTIRHQNDIMIHTSDFFIDDSTDQVSIQNAINSLNGKPGTIFIGSTPKITYIVDGITLPPNIRLLFEKGVILSQNISNLHDMTINGTNVYSYFPYKNISNKPLILIDNVENVSIENATLNPVNDGIAIKDSDNVNIINSTIDGLNITKWNGFSSCFSNHVSIKNTVIKNCGVKLPIQNNGDGTFTNKYGYGYGLSFDYCNNVNVIKCIIDNNGGNNISLYNSTYVYIDKNEIKNSGMSGIQVLFPFFLNEASGQSEFYGTWGYQNNLNFNLNIKNNYIHDNGADAFDVNNNYGRTDGYLYNGTTYDYYTIDTKKDLKLTYKDNIIENNGMIDGVPIVNDGSNCTLIGVSNCLIENNNFQKSLNTAPAVYITYSTDIRINTNKIIKENCQCILISTSENITIDKNVITPLLGNKEMIYSNSETTNVKITNNKIIRPSNSTFGSLVTAFNNPLIENNHLDFSGGSYALLSKAKFNNNTMLCNTFTYVGGSKIEKNKFIISSLRGTSNNNEITIFKDNEIEGSIMTDGYGFILIENGKPCIFDSNKITVNGTRDYDTAFQVFASNCKIINNEFKINITGISPFCIKLDANAGIVEIGGNNYNNNANKVQYNSFPYSKFGVLFGSVVPLSGTWSQGDRILNSIPSVGQPKGWIFSSSATWISEGNL